MASGKVYTAAVIGCGRIGYSLGLDKKREQPASHTMALNDNSRINLVAGCDIDPVSLNTWHDANKKALVYRNSADLYTRQKLDLIVIAVNENAHLREAIDAIVSGARLVILEKPVALNMKEALKIKYEADRNKVEILVNHERRFSEDYIAAKQYMSQIGDLVKIEGSLSTSHAVYDPAEEETGSYSLIHDATHLVDSILYFLEDDKPSETEIVPVYHSVKKYSGLLNKAEKITETTTRVINTVLNNPVITGLYTESDGKVRQLSAHYTTKKCPDVTMTINGRSDYFGYDIKIVGTKGNICIGNGYLKFYKSQKSSLYTGFNSLTSDKSAKAPKKTLYFANMVQNAVDFLDGKAPIKSTLQHGINSLAVLEEIKDKII